MTTRNIVPRTANEGTIGTTAKPWNAGNFNHLILGGVEVRTKKIFEASGTFTVPAGVTTLYVTAVAGGAGGCSYRAGGGGGGEAVFKHAVTVMPNLQIPITVGTGGAGDKTTGIITATTALAGNDGKDTVIGNLLTLKGGHGAKTTTSGSYAPGLRGGYGGGDGEISLAHYLQDSTTMIWSYYGGKGGGTLFGTGGNGGFINVTQESKCGDNGIGFGSGGGGGGWFFDGTTLTTIAAGDGANGIVVLEW